MTLLGLAQLLEDVRDESSKYGVVEAVAVPAPPPTVPEAEPGRVYVMFATAEQCSKAHAGAALCSDVPAKAPMAQPHMHPTHPAS